jgi:arylformamidase
LSADRDHLDNAGESARFHSSIVTAQWAVEPDRAILVGDPACWIGKAERESRPGADGPPTGKHLPHHCGSSPPLLQGHVMLLRPENIVDLSLELDAGTFAMRTPAGFKRDMQFAMEVLKEHDAPGGAGQIVRGVHMRLHAGSHVDAPEHNVRGGTQIHQLPLEVFIGDAIVADLRDKLPGKAITKKDLQNAVGSRIRKGDRLLLRTDHNNAYDGGSEQWMTQSPYLTGGATNWCIETGVVIVGYDFYHGNDEPDAPRVFHNSRTLSEHGVITMPYLKNLNLITKDRFTLIGFPLKLIGAEASPVRAVALL